MAFYCLPVNRNMLARGTTTPQGEQTYFGRAYLYDGRGAIPFVFDDVVARTIIIDTALNQNPGMEEWSAGVPTGYVCNNVSQQTGKNGSWSVGLGNGFANPGSVAFIVTVRPSEAIQVHAWIKGSLNSVNCSADIKIRNLQTGNYLNSINAWQDASTAALGFAATTTWTEYQSANVVVEDFDACQTEECQLLVTVQHTGNAGRIDVDDLWVTLTQPNLCMIHGHAFTPEYQITLESSLDGTTYQAATTLSPRRGPFYSYGWTPYSGHGEARYYRLTFPARYANSTFGVNPTPWHMGELVLGRAVQIQSPRWGAEVGHLRLQSRAASRAGSTSAQDVTGQDQRTLKLRQTFTSLDAWREFRDYVFRGTSAGADQAIWLWDTTDADAVMLGRMDSSWSTARTFTAVNEGDLTIVEDASPIRSTL